MTSSPVIRVLVVEDSLTIRRHIVEILSGAQNLEVVGEAADGKAAIALCQRLRPDVITMDMMLPVMTGVAATEYIMAYHPTPILIVSASVNRGEVFRTYDALAAGAVDVIEKPLGSEADDTWEERLVAAVRMVARIRVITHPRGRLGRLGQAHQEQPARPTTDASSTPRVVVVGASTGGPAALLTILSALPVEFPLPVVIVLHIALPFARALAEWLDSQVPLEVRYAQDGERLPPVGRGSVFLAPADRHLELAHGAFRLSNGPERHSCKPSVDVLFESVAREMGDRAIACLLTGMGKDGARGMLAIRESGGATIAQDEATSVVFGMPAEAIELGAATRVLPLPEIAGSIVRMASAANHPEKRS